MKIFQISAGSGGYSQKVGTALETYLAEVKKTQYHTVLNIKKREP